MNPRSPWPPLLLAVFMLASCFVPASLGNLALKQGLTRLGEVGRDDPHEFVTNGVVIHDTGASVYVPALVSRKTVQDLSAAARAWEAAHPLVVDPAAPPGWYDDRNPYQTMLDTVQQDADQFAGGDVDRLGDLGRYFASFVAWPFN